MASRNSLSFLELREKCYNKAKDTYVLHDITFRIIAGETEKPCTLVLMDDTFHEEEEELRLVLGTARSDSSFGASIGEQNETLIKIRDDEDSKKLFCCYWLLEAPLCALKTFFLLITESIIKFGETKFSVSEPENTRQIAVVKIPVLRLGDTSKVSVVRVHTKDGSATSGEDYHPISEGRIIQMIITSRYLFLFMTVT